MYCIIVFENIRSAVRPPVNEWPAFSKSPLWLESVFEKMRFSWSLSPNTCGRLGQTRGKKSPFSNKNWYRWTETESWYSVRRTLTRPFYKYFDFKTGTWLKLSVCFNHSQKRTIPICLWIKIKKRVSEIEWLLRFINSVNCKSARLLKYFWKYYSVPGSLIFAY